MSVAPSYNKIFKLFNNELRKVDIENKKILKTLKIGEANKKILFQLVENEIFAIIDEESLNFKLLIST